MLLYILALLATGFRDRSPSSALETADLCLALDMCALRQECREFQSPPSSPQHTLDPSACPGDTQTSRQAPCCRRRRPTGVPLQGKWGSMLGISVAKNKKIKPVPFLFIGNSVFLHCHSSFVLCAVFHTALSTFPKALAQNLGFPTVVFLN